MLPNISFVLDSQHSGYCRSPHNEWAAENGKETIDVPAIEVELQGNETIAEYINEINITKEGMDYPDYVRGAANITQTANSCNGITN